MRFENSKQVGERIAELHDKIQALFDIAKEDERDLSPEEATQVDALTNEIGEESADGKPATGLCAIQARLARFEKRSQALTAGRINGDIVTPRSDGDDPNQPNPNRSIIPARAQRYIAKIAFDRTREGQEQAYRAGQWIMGALFGNERSLQWCKDNHVDIRNAQTEGDDMKGGVLVPHELESAIIRLVEDRGIMAANARQWPMGSDTMSVPRRTGGVTAYFVGEATAPTASNMTFDSVNLTTKKLGLLTRITTELAEDAVVSIADLVANEFGYAIADKQDECGFNGDGTSTYGGMTGLVNALAAGSIADAASGNTAFSTLDLVDFELAITKLPAYARANARWYVHTVGHAQSMLRLQAAAGGNTISDLAGGVGMTPLFYGYPVVFTQVLNSTIAADVSAVKLFIGDINQGVAMGVRRGMSMKVLNELYAASDEIGLCAFTRFDIVVHEIGTATAAGSIVGLKTPGS